MSISFESISRNGNTVSKGTNLLPVVLQNVPVHTSRLWKYQLPLGSCLFNANGILNLHLISILGHLKIFAFSFMSVHVLCSFLKVGSSCFSYVSTLYTLIIHVLPVKFSPGSSHAPARSTLQSPVSVAMSYVIAETHVLSPAGARSSGSSGCCRRRSTGTRPS